MTLRRILGFPRSRIVDRLTEVELPGSNPVMMDTTAVKDGDDYVINGQKWYTSSADGSEFAIVMAVTNPEAGPYIQASMIIVPTDTPGFNLVRNIPVMGHAGEDYFSHAEILYQNCRVPQVACWAPKVTGLSSPRSDSVPAASITVCAGSGSATGLLI